MKVPHDTRWDLPLPDRAATLAYMAAVEDALVARLARHGAVDSYFYRLTAFHEEMHVEAFLWTRQTLGYPAPRAEDGRPAETGPLPGDVAVPGGVFCLGAEHDASFLFDNEKWAHAV